MNQITENKILSILTHKINLNARSLKKIAGGKNSQAYSFQSEDATFIIRVNTQPEQFEKDKYAYENFSTPEIIIPKIIDMGVFGHSCYAISERVQGIPLSDLSKHANVSLLSEFGHVLGLIHETNITGSSGYGLWDKTGKAQHATWNDFLKSLQLSLEKSEGKDEWDILFRKGAYDKDLFKRTNEMIVVLSKYSSKERRLLHGDFGYDNVLVENGRITGVIDWELSKYGDFVYDIAWRDFWSSEIGYGEFLSDFFKNRDFSRYKERLLCYKLHIGLTSSGYYAKQGDREGYERTRNKLLQLLETI